MLVPLLPTSNIGVLGLVWDPLSLLSLYSPQIILCIPRTLNTWYLNYHLRAVASLISVAQTVLSTFRDPYILLPTSKLYLSISFSWLKQLKDFNMFYKTLQDLVWVLYHAILPLCSLSFSHTRCLSIYWIHKALWILRTFFYISLCLECFFSSPLTHSFLSFKSQLKCHFLREAFSMTIRSKVIFLLLSSDNNQFISFKAVITICK